MFADNELSSETSDSAYEQTQRFRHYISAVESRSSALVPSGSRHYGRGTFYSLHEQPLIFHSGQSSPEGFSDLDISSHGSYQSGPQEHCLGTFQRDQQAVEQGVFEHSTCSELCAGGADDHGPEALPWGVQYSVGSTSDENESSSLDRQHQTQLKTLTRPHVAVQHSEREDVQQTPIPTVRDQSVNPSRYSSGYGTAPNMMLFRVRQCLTAEQRTSPKESLEGRQQEESHAGMAMCDTPLAEGGAPSSHVQLAVEVACNREAENAEIPTEQAELGEESSEDNGEESSKDNGEESIKDNSEESSEDNGVE